MSTAPNCLVVGFTFLAAISNPPSPRSLETEIQLPYGPVHVLLEVLFPDLGPRPVGHVGHLVLDDLSRCDLSRVTVDRIERSRALRPSKPIGGAPRLLIVAVTQDSHRLNERLGVVDHGFPVESDELSVGVARRRQNLDRFEMVTPFPAGVLVPPLNVGRPRDQRVAIPEADGVPIPLRNTLT